MREQLKALAWGFLGVLLALGLWHAYQDHRLIDAARAEMLLRNMPLSRAPKPAVTVTPNTE